MVLNLDYLYKSDVYLRNKGGFKNEFIRKCIHITISFSAILLYNFVSIKVGIALFILAVIINIIGEKTAFIKFLKRVNRISFGHYFFIFGVFAIFLVSKYINSGFSEIVFYYTMLVLGLADALAVTGKYFCNSKLSKIKPLSFFAIKYGKKTLFGFTVFSIVSIISAFVTVIPFTGFELNYIIKALIISIMLGLIELLGEFGLDNLFIPLFSYLFFFLIW